MHSIFDKGGLLLMNGDPMALVTPAGVAQWQEEGVEYVLRYDQVPDPSSGQMKFRCIYQTQDSEFLFVLVNDPDEEGDFVVLLDHRPDRLC